MFRRIAQRPRLTHIWTYRKRHDKGSGHPLAPMCFLLRGIKDFQNPQTCTHVFAPQTVPTAFKRSPRPVPGAFPRRCHVVPARRARVRSGCGFQDRPWTNAGIPGWRPRVPTQQKAVFDVSTSSLNPHRSQDSIIFRGPVEGTAANSAAQRAKEATPALQQQLHSLSHRRTSTVFGWGGQNLN